VLTHHPDWYSPDHAIFVKRQRGTEAMKPAWRTEDDRHILPLHFATPDGVVTKLLLWSQAAGDLRNRFVIDPEYLPTLEAAEQAAEPPQYLAPPRGAVRVRP
jgi:hypothetical protein